MTVIVDLMTGPVKKTLRPPYQSISVTVRRLRTPEWDFARDAAQIIVKDDGQLLRLMADHDLLPPGGLKAWYRIKAEEPLKYGSALAGLAMWLTSVECALIGVVEWSGLTLKDGSPAPLTREVLMSALLDEALSSALLAVLTEAAHLLVIEGKPLGASPNGSSEPDPTASAPTSAETAGN